MVFYILQKFQWAAKLSMYSMCLCRILCWCLLHPFYVWCNFILFWCFSVYVQRNYVGESNVLKSLSIIWLVFNLCFQFWYYVFYEIRCVRVGVHMFSIVRSSWLITPLFRMKSPSLFIPISFSLKSILSFNRIAMPAYFLFLFT